MPNKTNILNLLHIKKLNVISDEKTVIENLSKFIPEVIIKEVKEPKEIKYCIDCNIEVQTLSIRCIKCSNINRLKISVENTEHPSLEQLKLDLINLKSFVKVGEKYNVSDNCIRKWIKKYEKYDNLQNIEV